MAVSWFRRAAACTVPSLFAAMLAFHPGAVPRSPDLILAGTDSFGAGTGGIDSTGTAVYHMPGDITGWGISGMKPLTPPAPPPYQSPPRAEPQFGAGDFSGNNIRGGDTSGDDYGGALAPLDQR